MKLYKFTESKFMNAFFETGSLRLGTIYDFQDIITHASKRGDDREGMHQLIRDFEHKQTFTNIQNEPLISEFFGAKGNCQISLEDVSLSVQRQSPNAFIFCTSYVYTKDMHLRWNREDTKTDACYVITEPKEFFRAISEAIYESAFYETMGEITYAPSPIPYDSPFAHQHPAFTKDEKEYSWQKEFRTVWLPKGPITPLKPWNIKVPDAIKYCKPFATL